MICRMRYDLIQLHYKITDNLARSVIKYFPDKMVKVIELEKLCFCKYHLNQSFPKICCFRIPQFGLITLYWFQPFTMTLPVFHPSSGDWDYCCAPEMECVKQSQVGNVSEYHWCWVDNEEETWGYCSAPNATKWIRTTTSRFWHPICLSYKYKEGNIFCYFGIMPSPGIQKWPNYKMCRSQIDSTPPTAQTPGPN